MSALDIFVLANAKFITVNQSKILLGPERCMGVPYETDAKGDGGLFKTRDAAIEIKFCR